MKIIRFNESLDILTKDIAQEIIFYYGENCYHDALDDLEILFDIIYKKYDLQIVMYETSYKEMMEFTTYLYNYAKSNKDLEKDLIKVYKLIRQKLSKFPTIVEIEDIFLELIDDHFNFAIHVNTIEQKINYKISIQKNKINLQEFFKVTKQIEGTIKKLEKYNPSISKCLYTDNYMQVEVKLDN